jgi:chemotaxis protein histidine kinase CheA
MEPANLEDILAELRTEFIRKLPERFQVLIDAHREYAGGGASEALQRIRKTAHSLAGAGGTFGFPALTQNARLLERLCMDLSDVTVVSQNSQESQSVGLASTREDSALYNHSGAEATAEMESNRSTVTEADTRQLELLIQRIVQMDFSKPAPPRGVAPIQQRTGSSESGEVAIVDDDAGFRPVSGRTTGVLWLFARALLEPDGVPESFSG